MRIMFNNKISLERMCRALEKEGCVEILRMILVWDGVIVEYRRKDG